MPWERHARRTGSGKGKKRRVRGFDRHQYSRKKLGKMGKMIVREKRGEKT